MFEDRLERILIGAVAFLSLGMGGALTFAMSLLSKKLAGGG